MTSQPQAIPISPRRGGDQQKTERSVSLSVSPTQTFHHSPLEGSFGVGSLQRTRTAPKNLKPFDSQDIKILLLENVNQSGKDILSAQGYQVESLKSSLPEDQLIEKIRYRLFFCLLPLHLLPLHDQNFVRIYADAWSDMIETYMLLESDQRRN
jgi:hypothetical protein